MLDSNHYLIASINGGSHWVLVYSYEGAGSEYSDFRYHDSGSGAALSLDGVAAEIIEFAVYLHHK